MAAHASAVRQIGQAAGQIGLYDRGARPQRVLPPRPTMKLCAGCRAKEARYGFRDPENDAAGHDDRPRTLCFECFRMELDHRQRVIAQLARGWNAEQVALPLEQTLRELDRRRRRAQIAARHAIGA
jgi:hypothetical protein